MRMLIILLVASVILSYVVSAVLTVVLLCSESRTRRARPHPIDPPMPLVRRPANERFEPKTIATNDICCSAFDAHRCAGKVRWWVGGWQQLVEGERVWRRLNFCPWCGRRVRRETLRAV